jgi:DNA invertase Pin-like site-specific DNA recombinase
VKFAAVDLPEANDLTVGIMALVAQAKREAISKRTREALAVARSRGVRLGAQSKPDRGRCWQAVHCPADRARVAH